MTQREESQSIGVLMIVVFSAMLLWALTAVVWPVPVVYADDPEIITITVTSHLETYFYDPGLDPTGGTVYFNSVGGEGAGQVLTVRVTCSGMIDGSTFEGAPAFGDTPPLDTSAPWQVTYTVEAGVGTQSGIVFTVTNRITETDTAVITFIQDNTDPTVMTSTLNETSNFLHADKSTLYYGDDMDPVAVFWAEGYAQDKEAGPHQATYSDAFGGSPSDDDLNPPSYHWEGRYYPDANDWGNGTITVTVSDKVGNSTTQIFTYTRDIISPTIYYGSPSIFENSPYLHANGTTVYYSDQMGSEPQSFTVPGNANDEGGAGLYRVTFSSAFGVTPPADYDPANWSGTYDDVESGDNGDGPITVTVSDNVSNWSQKTFNYIEDATAPTVNLTSVTSPGYDENTDPLDTDGSNWYNTGDFPGGNWVFTSNTADDGAGRAFCAAFWDHSKDAYDHTTSCTLGGDGSFSGLDDEDNGTVTVAVILADKVGNSSNDAVVFNIDNIGPVITSTYISEDSDYLYRADDLITIYYGDEMTSVVTFTVNGSSNDTGVGFVRAKFSSAFGSTPDPDTTPTWSGRYYPDNQDWGDGTIYVTVYDLLGNAAEQTFNYFRDTEPPTVVVTCPVLTSQPFWDVSWNGQDPSPDSGVNHYDVQYSEVSSDGPWQDWHTDTLLTEDTFGPYSPVPVEDGQTYYFRARAEDNVSDESPYTNGEDATTYDSDIKKVFLPIIMKGYCGCGPDNYEPNDSCDQAYGPLTSGQTYQSWISCCDQATSKNDYFYIDINTTNAINIYLTDIPAGTDYDLYLYKDPCGGPGNPVAKSDRYGSSSERISYNPFATGRYYIRVCGFRGSSSSPYSLRVTYDQ